MDIQEMIRRLHEQADALAHVISATPKTRPELPVAGAAKVETITARNGTAPKTRAATESALDSGHES